MDTLKLDRYLVGKCNCLTKTPEISYHDELCYYRLKTEKLNEKKYMNPSVAVDAIILCEGDKIFLIERENPPYGWALPGGFVDYGESLETATVREAKEETNIDIKLIKQLGTYSEPDRDPRQHVISTVYVARPIANGQVPEAKSDAKNLQLFDLYDLPELAFDHSKILEDFIEAYEMAQCGGC